MPSFRLHTSVEQVPTSENTLPQLFSTPSGLAILEIQGIIHTPSPQAEQATVEVGKLSFPLYDPDEISESKQWHKQVHLDVGNHQRLIGEVKKLAKPLAIIRKRDASGSASENVELEVVEIIHYKLLFSNRPEPIGD